MVKLVMIKLCMRSGGGRGDSHLLPSGTHYVKRVGIVLAHLKQAYCIT